MLLIWTPQVFARLGASSWLWPNEGRFESTFLHLLILYLLCLHLNLGLLASIEPVSISKPIHGFSLIWSWIVSVVNIFRPYGFVPICKWLESAFFEVSLLHLTSDLVYFLLMDILLKLYEVYFVFKLIDWFAFHLLWASVGPGFRYINWLVIHSSVDADTNDVFLVSLNTSFWVVVLTHLLLLQGCQLSDVVVVLGGYFLWNLVHLWLEGTLAEVRLQNWCFVFPAIQWDHGLVRASGIVKTWASLRRDILVLQLSGSLSMLVFECLDNILKLPISTSLHKIPVKHNNIVFILLNYHIIIVNLLLLVICIFILHLILILATSWRIMLQRIS